VTAETAEAAGLTLASYKLRLFEGHVRAVPARGADGCPFAGPGVDLRGEDAADVLAELGPVRAWLLAREPRVVLRSFSADLARPRVLVTLEPGDASADADPRPRPRVLRFDPPWASDLLDAAAPLEAKLKVACARMLRRRPR
jgi:hypothetical protein